MSEIEEVQSELPMCIGCDQEYLPYEVRVFLGSFYCECCWEDKTRVEIGNVLPKWGTLRSVFTDEKEALKRRVYKLEEQNKKIIASFADEIAEAIITKVMLESELERYVKTYGKLR